MKTLLSFLCLLFLSQITAQEVYNFKLVNQKIIWQKVYDTKLSPEQIVDRFITTGSFEEAAAITNGTTGQLFRLDLDHATHGISYWQMPGYLQNNSLEAFVIIEFKKDKFRITLKKIRIRAISSEMNVEKKLESYALKKENTAFTRSFEDLAGKILDATISNFIKNSGNRDINW